MGFVGAAVGIATAPASVWRWLYPLPLISVLAVLLALSLVYIGLAKRKPSLADQQRLDRVLSTLPREAMRRIEQEDFVAAWRARIVYPVAKYLNEMDGSEEHFDSRALEKRRRSLYQAADRFTYAEAMKGFSHQLANGFRNTGWSDGELDVDPEKLALAEERGQAIRSTAAELLEAHEDLVHAARRRGLSLDALSSDPPVASWEADGSGLHREPLEPTRS